MSFQRIVLTVALVTLIIVLCIVAYLIHSARGDAAFPPETPACPDYFEAVASNNGQPSQQCRNVQGLGRNAPGVTNFESANGGNMSCPSTDSSEALKARCLGQKLTVLRGMV